MAGISRSLDFGPPFWAQLGIYTEMTCPARIMVSPVSRGGLLVVIGGAFDEDAWRLAPEIKIRTRDVYTNVRMLYGGPGAPLSATFRHSCRGVRRWSSSPASLMGITE
jgi:hypothetical protein